MWDRLAIGTANWGKAYRGHQVPEDDIKRILAYCQSSGISFIDTATAYECDWEMENLVNSYFHVQCKVTDDNKPSWANSYISHDEDSRGDGRTFYDVRRIHAQSDEIINMPYSIVDRSWEKVFGMPMIWQARSVFCGGKVFTGTHNTFVRLRCYAQQLGLPVGTLCILFCLMNSSIDKVIIGADSYEQFKENLRFFQRMGNFQIDDLDIIDLRRTND